jgi:hypothetical protein
MTPIARVVYSPLLQLVVAGVLVAGFVIAQLRPTPAVVVVMPPAAQAATTIVTPLVAYPACWYYAPRSWRGYCGD